MPNTIDNKVKKELSAILVTLKNPVRLLLFTQQTGCPGCIPQKSLLTELCALSDNLTLTVVESELKRDEVRKYAIENFPATAVIGKKDYGIRFYGITAGYEFPSLLKAILMVSLEQSGLDPAVEELIGSITREVHLKILTTPTCPYCPAMVQAAHQFAFLNPHIRADMIDAAEFPALMQKHSITGVPTTFINETHSFPGALPVTEFYLEIIKAVDPGAYEAAQVKIRKLQGINKSTAADETHAYAALIVGGGPAAMSAALYATRKGLDVAVIAKKMGGQMTYTASIDNYLGLSNLRGEEVTELFRVHMETYAVAEALGVGVTRVEAADSGFWVHTDDGRRFRGLSVIYCAGKEYLRLGVPGEEKFIGRGIGFCATCDAPLFQGRRVAVVGAGNSAFTSARDLLSFASEIHLICRKTEFKADALLVEEVRKAPNVTLHSPMEVREFLGDSTLTGIRLAKAGQPSTTDLPIDGVFLEIGLTPNSSALRPLIELNGFGEVPVNRDQSTALKGLFAAGDVTDTPEKQISVAVGQGALAALSAYKYLVDNKLVVSTGSAKDTWEP